VGGLFGASIKRSKALSRTVRARLKCVMREIKEGVRSRVLQPYLHEKGERSMGPEAPTKQLEKKGTVQTGW